MVPSSSLGYFVHLCDFSRTQDCVTPSCLSFLFRSSEQFLRLCTGHLHPMSAKGNSKPSFQNDIHGHPSPSLSWVERQPTKHIINLHPQILSLTIQSQFCPQKSFLILPLKHLLGQLLPLVPQPLTLAFWNTWSFLRCLLKSLFWLLLT